MAEGAGLTNGRNNAIQDTKDATTQSKTLKTDKYWFKQENIGSSEKFSVFEHQFLSICTLWFGINFCL